MPVFRDPERPRLLDPCADRVDRDLLPALALEKGLAVAVANTERADPGGAAPALNALPEHRVQGGGGVARALNRMPRKLGRAGLGGLARFY